MRVNYFILSALAILMLGFNLNIPTTEVKTEQLGFNLLWSLPLSEQASSFDDLYYIQTFSRNKILIIHCNAAYCYKQRSNEVLA